MSDQSIPVATLAKNSREQVRVSLSRFRGHPLCDLRVHVPVEGTEAWAPTKKGLACNVAMLDDLIRALLDATTQATALGWMPSTEGTDGPEA